MEMLPIVARSCFHARVSTVGSQAKSRCGEAAKLRGGDAEKRRGGAAVEWRRGVAVEWWRGDAAVDWWRGARSLCFWSRYVALLGLYSCTHTSSPPAYLTPTLILPKNNVGVFLNEDLIFFFSAELDRASITQESVRIVARDSRPARGSLSVNGSALTFTPAPVLASDLSDGGYAPDTDYDVEIRGFPWVDGVRGTQGEMLQRTLHCSFRTASASAPSDNLVFVDPSPEKRKPLGFFPPVSGSLINSYLMGPQDSIYLDCDKPIDPSTLRDTDFVLSGAREQVAVRARLLENEPEARIRPKNRFANSLSSDPAVWQREPRAALIELKPVKKPLAHGFWSLGLAQGPSGAPVAGPRDYSGNALWNTSLARYIEVGDQRPDAGNGSLREDFIDRRMLSPVAVPGADGTARWSDSGRVEVRYPAAAGDGSQGHVSLSGDLEANDVQARSLEIKAGAVANLRAEGLVVLRAQGRLHVRGRLVRDAERNPGAGREPEAPLDLSARSGTPKHALTLSAWLADMAAQGRTCTVLIAGGDLVIDTDAEVRANTPILLVAGGVVRVAGRVRATQGEVFVLGDGGGSDIQPPKSDADLLALDPPCTGNPLREELHYAVLSSAIPQRGAIEIWLSAQARGSTSASGPPGRPRDRWRVRYVREIEGAPASIESLGPVDDPGLLEPPGPVQILIELWVAPGPVFEPPFVDFVHLTWEQKKDERR